MKAIHKSFDFRKTVLAQTCNCCWRSLNSVNVLFFNFFLNEFCMFSKTPNLMWLCQLRHEILAVTSSLLLLAIGSNETKKNKQKLGMIICISANLSSQTPHLQNEHCQTLTRWAILCTRAQVCRQLIFPPALQQRSGVPSFFWLAFIDEKGGGWGGYALPFPNTPEIDPTSHVPFGSSDSSLPWYAVRKQSKAAIYQGIQVLNALVTRLNLDQILLGL